MKCIINEKLYWFSDIKNFLTILQFCYKNSIENIPRFCYHEKLSVAGNCRMCLIEDIESFKPIVSCTVLIKNTGTYYTSSLKVKKAREYMLEFLLLNHPLDCPICCQGGECDLQDLSELVGSDRGRFYEIKRAVINKNFGIIIKTVMNRCIHCTRCVRFSIELGLMNNLGILGRGNKTEIGTYLETVLDSNFSGNLVDICPVGASTSKPYSYLTRSWELKSFIVPDIYDICLSDLRFDLRGGNILRILPVFNRILNHEWLDDQSRYFFDSLKLQRLIFPVFLFNKILLVYSWNCIFLVIRHFFINLLKFLLFNNFKYYNLFSLSYGVISSKLNLLLNSFNNIFNICSLSLNQKIYYFNENFINNDFKNLFIFSKNLRFMFPNLFLYIKEKKNNNNLRFLFFGYNNNILHNELFLGSSYFKIYNLFLGKSLFSILCLKKSKFWIEKNFLSILDLNKLLYKYKKVNITISYDSVYELPNKIYTRNSDEINFTIIPNLIYNISNDNIIKNFYSKKSLCIYQGFLGDISVQFCNVILPSLYYYEISNSKLININLYKDIFSNYKFVSTFLPSISSNVKISEEIFLMFLYNLEFYLVIDSKNIN